MDQNMIHESAVSCHVHNLIKEKKIGMGLVGKKIVIRKTYYLLEIYKF